MHSRSRTSMARRVAPVNSRVLGLISLRVPGCEHGPLQIGAGDPAGDLGNQPGGAADGHPATGGDGGPLHIGPVQPGQQ